MDLSSEYSVGRPAPEPAPAREPAAAVDLNTGLDPSPAPLEFLPLRQLVIDYAVERGRARSLNGEAQDVHELDRRLRTLLITDGAALAAGPAQVLRLIRAAWRAYDCGRLMGLQAQLEELGFQRGLHRARAGSPIGAAGAESIEQRLQSVLADHEDILRSAEVCGGPAGLREQIEAVLEAAEERGTEQRLSVEQTAIRLYACLAGSLNFRPLAVVLARRRELTAVLNSLEPPLRVLAGEIYYERYGETLAQAARSVLRGAALRRTLAVIEGNDLSAAAEGIYLAWRRLRWQRGAERFPAELDDLLRPVSRYERRGAERLFDERYAGKLKGRLAELIEARLRGTALERARALLNGSFALADALALNAMLQRRGCERQVAALLEKRHNVDRRRLLSAFQDRYGGSLPQQLALKLRAGGLRDLALALLSEDAEGAAAARLRCGVERVPGFWLGRALLGRPEEERRRLAELYAKAYPGAGLAAEIEGRFRGREREILRDLMQSGRVAWGKLFYFCLEGILPDEAGLRSLLHEASPRQIAQAQDEFEKLWRQRAPWYERLCPRLFGRLESRLHWLGGDAWFDLHELLAGRPETLQDYHQQMRRGFRHERTGWLQRWIRFFSREGEVYRRDLRATARLLHHLERAENGASESGGARADRRQLEFLVRLEELDCSAVRKLKHFVGNLVTGNVAAAVVAGCALTLPTLHPDLLPVFAAVALISLTVRRQLKSLLKGKGYRWGEQAADAVMGVFDGVTLFVPQLLQQMVLSSMTNSAAKYGLQSGLNSLGSMVAKPRTGSFGLSAFELTADDHHRHEEPEDLAKAENLLLRRNGYAHPVDRDFAAIMEELWRAGGGRVA